MIEIFGKTKKTFGNMYYMGQVGVNIYLHKIALLNFHLLNFLSMSIQKLIRLSNKRKISDKQFLHLFNQLNTKQPISQDTYLKLLDDSSNEDFLIVISLSHESLFWNALDKLPINQQIRLLKKYQLKVKNIKNVDSFLQKSVHYSDYVMKENNESLINAYIFVWQNLIVTFNLKDHELVRKNLAKFLSFLNSNGYTKQFDYCSAKLTDSKLSLSIQPRLNNLTLNVNSKNYNHFENLKIFYFFNSMFETYSVPDNEVILKRFSGNFNGDCFKLISSIFNGIHLSQETKQPSYVRNNWKNFLSSRLPKFILAYKVENLEEIIHRVFEVFEGVDGIDTELRQYFIKLIIFNKMLSIKSFHRFFPNETRVNQQTLIHEMSNYNSNDNFNDNLNDKLYNINCEFISFEESNLIEYLRSVVLKVEFSMLKQLELVSTIEKYINLLLDEQNYEKLNRIILVLLNNCKLFQMMLFNLSSKQVILKIIKLLDQDAFRLNDNDSSFQEFFSYFGIMLLFIVECSKYIDLDFKLKDSFTLGYLHNIKLDYTNLTPRFNEEIETDKTIVDNYNNLVNDWINLLFDESEGLSDDLIRSIDVKQIYQLIPLIYQQAIISFVHGRINMKILNNGLDYLSQSFLLPCTVSIVKSLLSRISLKNKSLPSYLRILDEIVKLIEKTRDESSNEHKITSDIVLNLILNMSANALIELNVPSNIIGNYLVLQKIKSLEPKSNLIGFNFEVFKTNLIKVFNGTKADYELIGRYINCEESLLKETLISLNTANANVKTNNETLKFLIDFIISINLNKVIKSEEAKQFWINKFTNLKTDNKSYQTLIKFEPNIDYHYSSIFNIDGDGELNENFDQDKDDGLFDSISIDYCCREKDKVTNDLVTFHFIVTKFNGLQKNEAFLRSVNLIHKKLLNDLETIVV